MGEGNIGLASTENEAQEAPLTGNEVTYDSFAVELGGGARFYFTTNLSLALTVAGIYGNTENKFQANNPAGEAFKNTFGGTLVDWNVNTWSVVPGVAARYDWRIGRTRFELSSDFRYYHTESFGSSSTLISVRGNSQSWENKLDVDVPLGVKVFGRELRTGGFLARTELFGDLREGLDLDHVNYVNGRLVLDTSGKLWIVKWLGVGTTYYWAEDLTGWVVGLDARFQVGAD